MNRQAQLTSDIARTFGSQPEVARICTSIVTFVAENAPKTPLHLTYSLLKKETSPHSDGDLIAAVQYLIGARAAVLKMAYEFLDEHGEFHKIDESTVASAVRGEGFFHPDTGEIVEDYESSLLVYFTPTELAAELLQGKC